MAAGKVGLGVIKMGQLLLPCTALGPTPCLCTMVEPRQPCWQGAGELDTKIVVGELAPLLLYLVVAWVRERCPPSLLVPSYTASGGDGPLLVVPHGL